MTVVVGAKGQVVIEKPIRDALGIQPGDVAVQRIVDGGVEIQFFPAEHDRSLRGILEPAGAYRVSEREWDEARERAWRQAARAKMANREAETGPEEDAGGP